MERIAYILCIKDSPDEFSPVLFASTSEPDKNLRPWLDLGVQIEKIAKTHEGYLDLVDLEKKLAQYTESRRRLIGLFSGASRLSGILADDVATTILLHQVRITIVAFRPECNQITKFYSASMEPFLFGIIVRQRRAQQLIPIQHYQALLKMQFSFVPTNLSEASRHQVSLSFICNTVSFLWDTVNLVCFHQTVR